MSDKKKKRFSTLFFLGLKTAVLSLVQPPPTRTRGDKTAVYSTRKKTGEKKF
jgi:hypothetical protein